MSLRKCAVILVVLSFVVGCDVAPDEAALEQSARQSLKENDDRTAMIELKSILQANPENSQARRLLGELYLRQGLGQAAEKELTRAQQPGVVDVELALLLSQAFILNNELDKALEALSLPDSASAAQQAEAGLIRGDIYLAQGELQKARAAYDAAASAQPDSEWSQLAGVKVLLLDRDPGSAATRIAAVVERYPDSVEGWLLQGNLYFDLADFPAAEKSYEAALNATGTQQHTRYGFQARLGIIKSSLAQSDSATASTQIKVLLKQLPNHPLPKYFDALLAYQQQDYAKASERLSEVLAVMEKHLPGQLLMGATQFALGQYEQANQYLTYVINVAPDNQQARKMLAAVHMKLQSPQDAVKVLEPVVSDNSTNVELLRMVGLAALSAGEMDDSERYLSRALAQGESGEIRTDLAKIHLAKGEYDEAIKALEQVSGSAELQANMMIALTHLKKGEVGRAETAASQLAVDYPEEAAVYALMGGIRQMQGDRAGAIASYQQALAQNGQFVPALLELAKLAMADDRLSDAEEYLKQVIAVEQGNLRAYFGLAHLAERRKDLKQALGWMERARKNSPESVEPVAALVRYYLAEKQLDKAAEIVNEGIKKNPNNALLMRMDAQIKYNRGQKQEAIDALKNAVQKKPEDADLVILLASMQRQSGSQEQARQSLLKGLRSVSDRMKLEIELIELEIAAEQYDVAKARIDKLKADDPNSVIAYALAGHLNMVLKKYSDAAKAYQQAFNLNPSFRLLAKLMQSKHRSGKREEIDRDVTKWLSLSTANSASEDRVATLYMQLGENERAIHHYEAAVKRDGDNVPALNNLAWLYSLQSDPRSVATARKAYELAPKSSDIVDTLGWVLVKNGDYQEGIERLRDAYRMDSRNVEIAMHLVEALYQSGSGEDEARELLRTILKNSPEVQNRGDVQRLSSQLQL